LPSESPRMVPDSASAALSSRPQPAPSTRKRVYPKRVPSSIPLDRRKDALQSALAGRNLHQVAAETGCYSIVPIELWLRDIERRLGVVQQDVRDLHEIQRKAA